MNCFPKNRACSIVVLLLLMLTFTSCPMLTSAVPPSPAVKDCFTPADPAAVQLHGLLNEYEEGIREHFVLFKDIVPKYLEPLEKHGDKFWRSEHIGKWLDCAAAVWRYTGDPKIRELMDEAVRRMAAAQHTNGWLGGYDEPYRFYQVDWNARPEISAGDDKSYGWDVWCNFMSLEGLLKYHSVVTDDTLALQTAVRIGDLICATFGDGKQDIAKVPHDHGLGAMTCILGLMQLYEYTGEARYLEFARYVTRQFGRPGTMPIILSGTRGPQADSFPFASDGAVLKHAESELTLRGLCELYRMTGDQSALDTCRNVFAAGYAPLIKTMCLSGYAAANMKGPVPRAQREAVETCDIVPTLRWWAEMFQLTGDVTYLNSMERQMYNQLLCHLTVDGRGFMNMPRKHFTSPSGCVRRYGSLEPFDCCWSMGPVGISDLPGWAFFTRTNALLVNFYEPATFTGLINGVNLQVRIASEYPLDGRIQVQVSPVSPVSFALELRIPDWSHDFKLKINGRTQKIEAVDGILTLQRKWQAGDSITLDLPMSFRTESPMASAAEYEVIERGPLVLAMTRRFNAHGEGWSYTSPLVTRVGNSVFRRVCLGQNDKHSVVGWSGDALARFDTGAGVKQEVTRVTLVPFYDAGVQKDPYIAVFPKAATLKLLPPHLRFNSETSVASFDSGATVAADSEALGQDGCASYAIDRDLGTAWHSAQTPYPHWLEIKLSHPQEISRVIIHFADRDNHPTDFNVYATSPGREPLELVSVKGCALADYYWGKFQPIQCDSVRVVIQKSSDEDSSIAAVNEIELYRD
jgi:DUF1680 family protein